MGTLWGDTPLSEFQISKVAEAEGGYNYFLYIHARGYSVIMREKADETEYLYADGGFSGKNWSSRDSLEYTTYDKLQE